MYCIRAARNLVYCLILMPCLCHGILTTTPSSLFPGFECGFEINIFDAWCGMTQESQDDFDWLRKTSDDDSFTDPEPTVDHTTHLVHGHFLYAPTGTLQNGHSGVLNMPYFERNNEPQCLEFFYNIGGENAGQLNVYQWLLWSSRPLTPSWKIRGDTADMWIRGTFTIEPQEAIYTVSFEAVVGIDFKAFIALDDVSIRDGACPLENFTCTFEEDICSFTQDRTDDEDWYRSKGYSNIIYSAPSVDHTLGTDQGYYIFIESVYLSVGEVARVITPPLLGVSDGTPEACLTFFYHMLGPGVGELNVYVVSIGSDREDPAWTLSGNRGDTWRGAEVDITLADDFNIVFESVRGVTYIGDIALDDINFQRGDSCPGHHKPPSDEPQASCDFEEVEICGYEQNQTDDADWIWQNRASPFVDAGPLYDHTTKDEFGFYLFLYGDVGHRKTAQIISPYVPLQSGQACLDFWWHLYGNDEQKLSVYCLQDGKDISESLLLSMSGNYGDYWIRSVHEIPAESTPCRLIFEGTTGIHNRDDIAIDDVIVYEGEQCPQIITDFVTTTTPPTTNNVDCTFEDLDPIKAMCGWTQSIRDGFDWIIYNGPTKEYNSGPDVDHTLQTAEGHYMLIDSYEDLPSDSRAEIISPLVSPSSSSRCFKFWYFMSGTNIYFLNLYILPYGYTLPIDPDLQFFGNRGSEWLEGQLSVPSSTRSFYIVVEGTIGDRSYSADIAVDDFSLVNGVCTGIPKPNYPSVANCDFEKGLCGYTQPADEYKEDKDEFDWFLNTGPTGTVGSGPSADHTLGTAAGHYLYMEASQPRRPGDRARIISPVISYFNDTYCLVFFYHMSGDDTASLSVIQRGDYYTDQEIARLTGPDGTGWKPYNVDVGVKYGPIEIVFTGTVGNSYRGDIALDDITLTPGPCGGYPVSALCNFEYGYHYCQFTQSTDDELDWVWFDALIGETPPIDWSGYGSFMYVDGTNRTSGYTAVLRSPEVQLSRNHHCLSFVYAIQGDMRLDFIRKGQGGSEKTLLSFTKSTGRNSYQYQVEGAEKLDNYWILVRATVGAGESGLAVLDDFHLDMQNYCGVYPGSGSDSTEAVAIVLGILLVIAIILIAVGLHHLPKKTLITKSSKPNGIIT